MEKHQTSKKACQNFRQGFTLIEMLTVIAIIAILSAVVLVSTQSAMTKSRRTSAQTTASTVLPELVTCQDDGGEATNGIPVPGPTAYICCTDASCGNHVDGHTATWPEIRNGWSYDAVSGSVSTGNYIFHLTRDDGSGVGDDLITCSMATNSCE